MPFDPVFSITPKIASALMRIEGLKEAVRNLPVTPWVLKTLRETARLTSTHYSTQIEGNRLSQKEVEEVIEKGSHFAGRQSDEKEIKGYYSALEWLEKNIKKPITEETIKMIHALVEGEGRNKVSLSPYRDGQNVIKDSKSGAIIYMPPEAEDVPALMKELVEWLKANKAELPCPILGAITHYQFATIHPYYDGNGRTARLLTTLVLYQGGYDLKGIYSLEEYYARNLRGYYEAISRGDSHNYYLGRAEADITPWIEYFILGMSEAFEHIKTRAEEAQSIGARDKSELLRRLTPKQRKVLTLFTEQAAITAKDVEKLFDFSDRASRLLCNTLVKEGFLVIADRANKTRAYNLAEAYEELLPHNRIPS